MIMTRHTRLYGFTAATLLLAACSGGPAWKESVYTDQHFAVAFTAPPKVTKTGNVFLAEENDGTIDLGVTAACGIAPDRSPDDVMADAVARTRANGTVRNVTYTATGQTMGREMLIDRAGATTVDQRIFVKGGCLYLVFGTATGGPDDEQVRHFLDSFRLL